MRKCIALAAVSAVALTAPGSVSAGQGKVKYLGGFEATGTLSFVVERTRSGKKVFRYKWNDFPLDCRSGPETSSSRLTYAVRVENKRFSARAVDNIRDPGAFLRIRGEFQGTSSASGTMRLEGKNVPVDSGGRKNCDSGRVGWTAVAEVTP